MHHHSLISLSVSAVLALSTGSRAVGDEPPEGKNRQTDTTGANLEVPSPPPTPGPELLKYTPEQIEAAYEGRELPEAVSMYLVIVRGGQMDGKEGWFGPADTRFTWEWLCAHQSSAPGEPITKDQFKGPEAIFSVLDRDKDGSVSPTDLDWSSNNPWVQQSSMISRMFRRMDPSGDGEMSKEEWDGFFSRAAGGEDSFRFEQMRDVLMAGASGGFSPGDAPDKEMLIRGLMAGEVGSLQEGPDLDAAAPDFELRPLGGGDPIRLSDRIGSKPVVLTFGNFTCGPFRSQYPAVEAVRARHPNDAEYLLVYVREAHPTDGWAMKSNEKVGVAVAQPTSLEERVAVAEQCAAKLNPTMPLLVDDISDTVGNAYSGMPARMYVIDKEGNVAYKSGRGPFGFKPEEMEQSLMMLVLSEHNAE
jgi:thiol-disulfide isomerase/thioredoxin